MQESAGQRLLALLCFLGLGVLNRRGQGAATWPQHG